MQEITRGYIGFHYKLQKDRYQQSWENPPGSEWGDTSTQGIRSGGYPKFGVNHKRKAGEKMVKNQLPKGHDPTNVQRLRDGWLCTESC